MTAPPARVAVVGLGLVGGSVALDLAARDVEVVGTDVDPQQREDATAAGLAVAEDLAGLLRHGPPDLVVVATPSPQVAPVLVGLDALLDAPVATTDVASVQDVAELRDAGFRHVRHVGGHPMTGTERSGFRAARRGMFEGSPWLVTLRSGADATTLQAVLRTTAALGAPAVPVAPDEHDRTVALLSHLPHVLAYTAYRQVRDRLPERAEVLAGGSFRGLTRVAATRPRFWAEVLDLNREAVAEEVAGVRRRLEELEALLRDGADRDALEAVLAAGHRSVGRPVPDVPAPTSLPTHGPVPDPVAAELLVHGRGGLGVVDVVDGAAVWAAV